MKFVPYSMMEVKNIFLDVLNEHSAIIRSRNIQTTLIAGIGQTTIQYLRVWPDGTMVGTVNSEAGDGNVMVSSAFCIEGEKYLVRGSHIGLLYISGPILRRKFLRFV